MLLMVVGSTVPAPVLRRLMIPCAAKVRLP